MSKQHQYSTTVTWTGNKGTGTSRYDEYDRHHTFSVMGKVDIACSSDTPFRGDGSRHNPEDMLVYSLSSCHMLWYLHLCADAGVVVTDYEDNAKGTMVEVPGGGGHFAEVTLYPVVTVKDASMIDKANQLHDIAHQKCFIANSCNFPVKHQPKAVEKG
ncbi:OsmC family protein [Polluticoccus soli]|uniref:OsmC family protein n=1 Tax=Polluticoccus soli TaxID=3034150 RepID=UPI0023E11243|nr:OsmC family protein [Flavipsychrobacter sp. JY13-12]